jgi:bifunctional non-homologous end joining protein LigD
MLRLWSHQQWQTDFSVLQNELKGRSKDIVLVAFGLLHFNGYDFRILPAFERKAC